MPGIAPGVGGGFAGFFRALGSGMVNLWDNLCLKDGASRAGGWRLR
jgi:hypothetical protein